jgi:hypothetical protein
MSDGRKVGTGYQFTCDRCKRRLVGYNDDDGISGLELRPDRRTGLPKPYFRDGENEVCATCLQADKVFLAEMMKSTNRETTRNPNVPAPRR